jgi:uncharacterized membrane protein
MRGMALTLAIFTALTLCACGKSQDATPGAPLPPADAPASAPANAVGTADFSRPLNALGTDPFWSLKIRPGGLSFSAAGAKDLAAPNPGPTGGPDQATWSAMSPDGRPLTASLRAAACQEAGAGQTYPFTATVQVGGKPLTGCGAYADGG